MTAPTSRPARMAPVAMPMAARMVVMVAPLDVHATSPRLVPEVAAVAKGGEGGRGKEDDVHDGKGPAGLEHGAGLVGLPAPVRDGDVGGRVPGRCGGGGEGAAAAAVGVGDAAKLVDGGDEGGEEAEVDEGDEVGVCGRAVVAEEGEDGPGEGEDGDDEEDEDRVGRQGVVGDELVDEPGEHSHGGNQSDNLRDPGAHEDECEDHGGRMVPMVGNQVLPQNVPRGVGLWDCNPYG